MAYGVTFSTKKLSDEMFRTIITGFASEIRGYVFREDMSREYTDGMQNPSYMIEYENDNGVITFAITKIKNEYSLENIVPKESGMIPYKIAKEYAKTFVTDFRKFLKTNNHNNMSISLALKKKLTLENIISGRKTRKFFMSYINGYPLSHHPADTQRLDLFICAASRYCRKSIDLGSLYTYLQVVLKWPSNEAKWCCERIDAGLKFLRLNKKFL
jgi:hypothetical protein